MVDYIPLYAKLGAFSSSRLLFAENCLNMQYLSIPQPFQLEFNLSIFSPNPPSSPTGMSFRLVLTCNFTGPVLLPLQPCRAVLGNKL